MSARRLKSLQGVFAACIAVFLLGFADSEDQPNVWRGTSCERSEEENPAKGTDVASLQELLKQDKLWRTSKRKKGRQLNLRGKKVAGAEFPNGEDLSGADLSVASFNWTAFISVNLSGAKLSDSSFDYADLRNANLRGADLHNSRFTCAALKNADLTGANLGCVYDDSGTHCSDFQNADFRGAALESAQFDESYMAGAVFEPKSNPDVRDIAGAKGLEELTYDRRPDSLVQLRKEFQDTGFLSQERQITYALNRRQAQLGGPYERWFKTIAFDWTTQYGLNPGRSLQIWGAIFLVCWLIYAVFLRFGLGSGIYLQSDGQRKGEKDEKAARGQRIELRLVSPTNPALYPVRVLGEEIRLIYWAGFFSLMSAFNIGFHNIDLGRWLRLLTRTPYELRPEGWVRTIAGLQSLISMYLMAIWLLTYFGRPFQ